MPDIDRTRQPIHVERVHRLTQLQHHVLSDIDQETDRTHAAAAQTFGHPHRGRGGGVDTLDHTTHVTRRIGASIQIHCNARGAFFIYRRSIERHDFTVASGGDIEGDAAHAEAVGAVGGKFQFDAGVG